MAKSINAKFTADFSQFEKAIDEVTEVHIKTFERGIKEAGRDLERFATSFSGAKIQAEALKITKAIEAVGGVTTLTAAEQRKANATIDEAIRKYAALGQEAPAGLTALKQQLDAVAESSRAVAASADVIDRDAMIALKGFKDESAGAADSLFGLAGGVKTLFAGAVVGSLVAASIEVVNFGGELTDLSQQTGIATDDLQTLGIVGKKAGLDMRQLTTAVTQMSDRLASGDDSAVSAVRQLGLQVDDLIALAPDKAFERIAAAVGDVESPMHRTRLAMDLLGKTGAQALPILNRELATLREEAKESGRVIDAQVIKQFDELGDSLEDLKVIGSGLLAVALYPLTRALGALSTAAIEANSEIQRGLPEAKEAAGTLLEIITEFPEVFTKLQFRAYGADVQVFGQAATDAAAGSFAFDAGLRATRDSMALANAEIKALRTEAMAPLNDEQKQLARELNEYGKSNREIAQLVSSTELAVKKYLEAIKDTGKAHKDAAAATEKHRQELEDFKTDLLKVAAAFDKVQDKADDDIAKGFISDLKQQIKLIDDRMAAIAQNADRAEQLEAEADREIRRLTTGRVQFQIDEIRRLAEAEKRALDRSVSNWEDVATAIDTKAAASTLALIVNTDEYRMALIAVGTVFPPLLAYLDQLEGKTDAAAGSGERFGEVFVKSMKDALLQIPGIIADAILHDASAEETVQAAASQIGAAIGFAIAEGIAQGAGPIGAAIGSLAGLAIDAIHHSRAEKTAQRAAYEFGVEISEEFAQGIEDQANEDFGGNRQAAKIFNLADIIDEGGGIDLGNFATLQARLHDVYSMLETGAFTAAQAQDVLNESFGKFVEFVTRDGGRITKELQEIIRLNDELGTQSSAIAEFTSGEAKSALDSLGSFITTRGTIQDELTEAQTRLAELSAKSANDSEDIDPKDITAAAAEVERLNRQLAAIPLTAGGAQAAGAALFGIFERLSSNGEDPLEIIRQIDPLIESLDRQLAAAGLEGGAAFEAIRDMAALATDEIAGPALSSINAFGESLDHLHNADILNPEIFAGVTEQITATVQALLAQGKTVEELYPFIQDELQTIWELQQDFGYSVDEGTQALLDQAEAAGVVGDEHRSVQEQMLILQQQQTDAILFMAQLYGYVLPEAVRDFGDALDDLPDSVTVDGTVDWEVPDIPLPPGPRTSQPTGGQQPGPGDPTGFTHGTPGLGFMDFGSGTRTTLHGREAVVPEGQEAAFAAAHGVGGGGLTLQLQLTLAGRATRRDGEEFWEGFKAAIARGGDAQAVMRSLIVSTARDAGFVKR